MTLIAGKLETQPMWTGRWRRLADGSLAPAVVDVPAAAHVHGGAGTAHYTDRGFRPLADIPPQPPAEEIARLDAERIELAAHVAARRELLADALRQGGRP